GVDRDVAAAPPEAGDADALRHVLAVVPLGELGPALGQDVVPDRHHALVPRDSSRTSAAVPTGGPPAPATIPARRTRPSILRRAAGWQARAGRAEGCRWGGGRCAACYDVTGHFPGISRTTRRPTSSPERTERT